MMEYIRQTSTIKIEAKAIKTSKLAQRFYGLEEILALKNLKRNRKPYRSAMLSLTLSVVLFIAGSAFGTTLKQLAKVYTVEMDDDILHSPYIWCFTTIHIMQKDIETMNHKNLIKLR